MNDNLAHVLDGPCELSDLPYNSDMMEYRSPDPYGNNDECGPQNCDALDCKLEFVCPSHKHVLAQLSMLDIDFLSDYFIINGEVGYPSMPTILSNKSEMKILLRRRKIEHDHDHDHKGFRLQLGCKGKLKYHGRLVVRVELTCFKILDFQCTSPK